MSGMFMLAASTAMSLYGAKKQADAGNAAAAAEKQQLDTEAMSAEAQSQYDAEAKRRKAELMLSRALAVGAASGAGTTGLDSLLRDIGAEGETAAGYALYGGTEKAKGLRYRGDVGVYEAKAKGKATIMSAVAGAATSLYGAYGGGFFTQPAAPIESRT